MRRTLLSSLSLLPVLLGTAALAQSSAPAPNPGLRGIREVEVLVGFQAPGENRRLCGLNDAVLPRLYGAVQQRLAAAGMTANPRPEASNEGGIVALLGPGSADDLPSLTVVADVVTTQVGGSTVCSFGAISLLTVTVSGAQVARTGNTLAGEVHAWNSDATGIQPAAQFADAMVTAMAGMADEYVEAWRAANPGQAPRPQQPTGKGQAQVQAPPQPPLQPALGPGEQQIGTWIVRRTSVAGDNPRRVCSTVGQAGPSVSVVLHAYQGGMRQVTVSDGNWQLDAASRGTVTFATGGQSLTFAFARSAANQLAAILAEADYQRLSAQILGTGPTQVAVGNQRYQVPAPEPAVATATATCVTQWVGTAPAPAAPPRDPFAPR